MMTMDEGHDVKDANPNNEINQKHDYDRQQPNPDDSSDGTFQENIALRKRPALTIRARLILSFCCIFAFCALVSVWAIYALSEIEVKINFLEVAGNYMSEIQQARRFEKNYLLYGTNLDDAVEHLLNAERIISKNRETVSKILGPVVEKQMRGHLSRYHTLLLDLGKTEHLAKKHDIEASLRQDGALMVSYAQDFVEKERDNVNRLLLLSRRIPFIFLVILLILIIVIVSFLINELLRTLSRFMQYTQRVGQGDFTPITPRRKYRDEFSELGIAFNRMIHELDRRHQILVESHKLRAVGTLVAGVAHELNNPLNNTMLTADSLLEDFSELTDDEKREMLNDIISETERSSKIVRNLLDFARESKMHIKPLTLAEILENSIRLVANQIMISKINLVKKLADNLPSIHGDEQMLQQVFVNLILNAVDALPEKGTITITTRKSSNKDYVEVDVMDNGPGIPEHILSRVFEPFFTTKDRDKGTGLGLSVSQGMIHSLGGYITIDSKEGKGTTFKVFLPVTSL